MKRRIRSHLQPFSIPKFSILELEFFPPFSFSFILEYTSTTFYEFPTNITVVELELST